MNANMVTRSRDDQVKLNGRALDIVLEYLYPGQPRRKIWASALTPKLLRIGTPFGFLGATVRLRGFQKFHKLLFSATHRIIRGTPPLRVIGEGPAPPGRGVSVYTQGSSNAGIIIDRHSGRITKTIRLPEGRSTLDRERDNLHALNAANLAVVPRLHDSGEVGNGTIGFLTLELLTGRPVPPKRWAFLVENRLIPAVGSIFAAMASPHPEPLDPYLSQCLAAARDKGWDAGLCDAIPRALERTASEGPPQLSQLRITRSLVHHDLARHNVLVPAKGSNRVGDLGIIDWAGAYRHSLGALLVEIERQTGHYCRNNDRAQTPRRKFAYWSRVTAGRPVTPADLATGGMEHLEQTLRGVEPLLAHPQGVTILLLVGLLEKMSVSSPDNRKLSPIIRAINA